MLSSGNVRRPEQLVWSCEQLAMVEIRSGLAWKLAELSRRNSCRHRVEDSEGKYGTTCIHAILSSILLVTGK